MGREVWLGYTYYLNGGKTGSALLLELPEHFREIDEEDADDRPVELPEGTSRGSLKHPIRTRKKCPINYHGRLAEDAETSGSPYHDE